MECVANYEIKTECSVVADDLVLRIKHPKGLYRARVQNIPRNVFTTPFLLSLHLYFDASDLEAAQNIMDDLLVDCLNMLAFTTGCRFQRHRIKQLVDATPGENGMRTLFMWTDAIEYDDPHPFIRDDTTHAVERLLEFDIPPAIRRAMRWYRLGINATVPDDQFMNFWFALEIVAEFQKSTDKVPSNCPKCLSPLYCEKCKTHPVHKPYPKQAIQDLLKAVDKDCGDAIIERLDKTRNGLMHGSTLKEIEGSLPEPHEEIVDVLGRLLWRALIHQFPREMFDGKLSMGYPSTYIHRTVNAIAKMQTTVQVGADGDLDLRFKGITATMEPFGPPQSALPTIISMSSEQHGLLGKLSYTKGDHQEMCKRIYHHSKIQNGITYAQVLATDMTSILHTIESGETGEWQNLFREIFEKSNH